MAEDNSQKKEKQIQNKAEVVSALNQILKGEHMAIDIYNDFINKAKKEKTKKLLQRFQQDHKDHATTIATRIQNLGAAPQENRGLASIMSNTMMEIGSLLGIKPKNKEILEEAYNGEQKGINKVEEIMNQKLDSESKKLIARILSTDHDHLKELKELLSSDKTEEKNKNQ